MPDIASTNTAWIDKAPVAPVTEPVTETPPVVEAPVVEAPVVDAPPPDMEYFEAKFGDEIIKIPKGAEIQIERKGENLWVPVETMRGSVMMEYDYNKKTSKLAEERREWEAREQSREAEAARVKAFEADLQDRESRLYNAMGDPVEMAQWEQHQQMLATNPVYKQAWQDSQDKRKTDAENAVYKDREIASVVQTGVEKAVGWLADAATQYPTVNPERIRVQYARDLADGRASLDPAYVEGLFKAEADYLAERLSPTEKRMAELEAKLAAIPPVSNAQTQHAVTRAKTPPVAPVGQPASPVPMARKREPVPMRGLAEMNDRWAQQRD